MRMLSFIFGIVYGLFEIAIGFQLLRRKGWDPINQFNPATHCACPKPRPGFPISYVVVFLCVQVFSEFMYCFEKNDHPVTINI